MRKALLWASTSRWLRERAVKTSFVRRSVKRFMPGEGAEDAIAAARSLRDDRLTGILTHLGENLASLDEASAVRDHYLGLLDLVRDAGLDAHMSVKPTQLGQDHDPEVCFQHCATLLERCVATGSFLWLDMESSPYVDGTLALYRRLRERSEKVGVAVQAYLHRTAKDIEGLLELGSAIRLVKGAYLEPPSIAFERKADVDASYFELASRIIAAPPRSGALLHIATHDVALQERLRAVLGEHPAARFEIAMLYGIQASRQRELAASGIPTRCLISYGEHWFPWYMRRLAERPANVWFVARNVIRR